MPGTIKAPKGIPKFPKTTVTYEDSLKMGIFLEEAHKSNVCLYRPFPVLLLLTLLTQYDLRPFARQAGLNPVQTTSFWFRMMELFPGPAQVTVDATPNSDTNSVKKAANTTLDAASIADADAIKKAANTTTDAASTADADSIKKAANITTDVASTADADSIKKAANITTYAASTADADSVNKALMITQEVDAQTNLEQIGSQEHDSANPSTPEAGKPLTPPTTTTKRSATFSEGEVAVKHFKSG